MRTIKTLTLLVLLLTSGSRIAWAQKGQYASGKLNQFVEKHFDRWDHNHDGVLTLDEVDRKVEDHSVVGREAAAIFRIRERMTAKGNPPHLSHQQLLSLAKDRGFEKSVDATTKQLETINRSCSCRPIRIFPTFHQGRLGDCYLLCTIAAQVHRNPKPIRDMIHPVVTGGFQVAFGNGQKIQVVRLTDTELLFGTNGNHHGSWLAVFEKAYGIIRENRQAKRAKSRPMPSRSWRRKHSTAAARRDHFATDWPADGLDGLGQGGPSRAVAQPAGRYDQKAASDLHRAVIDKPPPGVISGHCYAIFGYNVKQRKVNIFNPWGNDFTPQGHLRDGQWLSHQTRPVHRCVGSIPAGIHPGHLRDRQAVSEEGAPIHGRISDTVRPNGRLSRLGSVASELQRSIPGN